MIRRGDIYLFVVIYVNGGVNKGGCYFKGLIRVVLNKGVFSVGVGHTRVKKEISDVLLEMSLSLNYRGNLLPLLRHEPVVQR